MNSNKGLLEFIERVNNSNLYDWQKRVLIDLAKKPINKAVRISARQLGKSTIRGFYINNKHLLTSSQRPTL